ncbi:MAG: hypothetical protein LAO76_18535 [Acidobacteriia bacterium]|nr:hypothetical protein [Terriglobia bacterium]
MKTRTPWIPDAPILISQAATAAPLASHSDAGPANIEDAIAEVLKWDYTVQFAHNFALRDELYLDVIFNADPAGPNMEQLAANSGLLLEHFFIELPDEIEMMRLSGRNQSGGPPSQWPVVTVQDQVWDHQSDSPADHVLKDEKEWWQVSHCFENVEDPLSFFGHMTLIWRNLDFRQRRTANLSLFVKQIVKIVADGETKESIYQSHVSRFLSPVAPLLQCGQTRALTPAATLAQTLQDIFKVIAPTQELDCHLRVVLLYEHQLAGPVLPVVMPVSLVDWIPIDPSSVPAIASMIAQKAAAWYKVTAPSTAGAALTMRLTLFGTFGHQQLPLVQIDAISILGVPKEPEWWNGPA